MNKTRRHALNIILMLLCFCPMLPFYAGGKEMVRQELADVEKAVTTNVSASKADTMFNEGGVIFLDVREPAEFNQGHIPGAINIPMHQVEQQIAQKALDKSAPILIYCRSGRRSSLVTATLIKKGYTHLMNLDGGIKAWSKAGYPVE